MPTRSSQKKRTTDEHNDDAANLEVNNPDKQKKSPTKRSKDDSSPGVNIETEARSSAVNGLTPEDEEFVSDSRKSAIAQVTRLCTCTRKLILINPYLSGRVHIAPP